MNLAKKRNSACGFTLLEMIVTLGVMTLVSAIAIPAFMGLLPGMRLNSSARQIFVAFARARQGAVTQNADACVKFSTANNTVVAWVDNGPGSARGNGAKDSSEPYIFEGETDEGVSIEFFFPYDTMRFNSRGLPVGTGTYLDQILSYYLYLRNSQNRYKIIRVTPVGGIVIS